MIYGALIKKGKLYTIAFLGLLPIIIFTKTRGEKSIGNTPYISESLILDVTTSFSLA